MTVAVLRVSGASAATPVDASAVFAGPVDVTQDTPAVTTTVADATVLRILGSDRPFVQSFPAGTVVTLDKVPPFLGTGTSLYIGSASQAAAGDSGVGTFALGTPRPCDLMTVALRGP